MNVQQCDLLIRHGHIITMNLDDDVFPDGAIAVSGTRIAAVGPDASIAAAYSARETISAGGGVVHPGLIECHMHISFLLWRWTYPDVAWDRYIGYIQDYYERLTAEQEHLATLLACVELARNGTTCYLDAGSIFEPDAAAEATVEAGIRGVLGDPFILDIRAPHRRALSRIPADRDLALARLGGQLKRNEEPDGLVRGHIALLGLGSASDELELAAKDAADRGGVVLNQHQSWDQSDVDADDEMRGMHPLRHFAEIGVLGENCTWSHVNFVRDDEIAPVIESGMSVCWCPTASMLLGVGATQRGMHAELYGKGVNVCLGSDSAASSGAYDTFEQGFLAVLTARDKMQDRSLTAEDALIMATRNGARAVGLGSEIGTIEPGKRADVVLHRTDLPEAQPGVDPIRTIIFSSKSKSVDTVVVNGDIVVRHGRSTRVDEEELYARARAESRRLRSAAGHDREPSIGGPRA